MAILGVVTCGRERLWDSLKINRISINFHWFSETFTDSNLENTTWESVHPFNRKHAPFIEKGFKRTKEFPTFPTAQYLTQKKLKLLKVPEIGLATWHSAHFPSFGLACIHDNLIHCSTNLIKLSALLGFWKKRWKKRKEACFVIAELCQVEVFMELERKSEKLFSSAEIRLTTKLSVKRNIFIRWKFYSYLILNIVIVQLLCFPLWKIIFVKKTYRHKPMEKRNFRWFNSGILKYGCSFWFNANILNIQCKTFSSSRPPHHLYRVNLKNNLTKTSKSAILEVLAPRKIGEIGNKHH